jgi:hypothetical protein
VPTPIKLITLFTKKRPFERLSPISDAPAQTIDRASPNPVELPRSESRTVPVSILMAQVTRLYSLSPFKDFMAKYGAPDRTAKTRPPADRCRSLERVTAWIRR